MSRDQNKQLMPMVSYSFFTIDKAKPESSEASANSISIRLKPGEVFFYAGREKKRHSELC